MNIMESETPEGLEELLVVWPRTEDANTSNMSLNEIIPFVWSTNNTKILIDLYKKNREKVGSMKIKNLKALWKLIAEEMSEILNFKIFEKNVENRWKVLERNYKKYVENKNATGRGRKIFEFAADMEEAYGNKKNIRPEILLGSGTLHVPSDVTDLPTEQESVAKNSESGVLSKQMEVSRKKILKGRKTVLQQIREDRLVYQEKRLNFLRQAHEEIMPLFHERNEIEKERNRILKEKKCTCHLV